MLTALSPVVFALSLAGGASAPHSTTQISRPSAPPSLPSPLGVSLGGGSTSGIGLGVRKHFGNRWGFHATGIPVIGELRVFAALGVQGMYSFYRGRIARMYGLLGVQGIYSSESHREYPSKKSSFDKRVFHTSFGPGVGLELHFNKRISWALELPVAAIISSDLRSRSRSKEVSDSGFQILPIPNSALTIYY